ncbi:MAG: TrkA family potassium uptake protein [SAR202 cluster bacterium]|nr:TrkA family potassium uptake protein [SAR202 cluster bacterium]
MAEQIVLAGLGRFGSTVARGLTKAGFDVLAVDRNPEVVKEFADVVSMAMRGEATSFALWGELPTKGANIGIVAFSTNVESNILTALVFRKLGIKRIIAKSESELHTELLRAIGIEAVVEPVKESAEQLVHTLGTRILDYLDISGDFGVAKIQAAEVLKRVSLQKLYQERKVTILAIQREGKIILQPSDNEQIRETDVLIAAGKDVDLRRLPGVGG